MAFSNTPEKSTYRTVDVKFDATSTLRSASNSVRRDSHIINFYYDRASQENKEREVFLKKRPGVSATAISLNKVSSTDVIRGYFYEEQEDIYFWAVGNKVYKYIPSPAGVYTALIATIATTTGEVHFETFQKSTGEVYILFSDGTQLWSQRLRVYPDTAGTAVADADMPTPHMPRFAVLDGYVLLAKGNTIYSSDVDTFDAWTAGNDIDCEMSSDNIKALVKNKNYIAAFGYNSLEVFWNAANATGSPLTRNDSGYKSIGYITGMTRSGDLNYFVGQELDQSPAVYSIDGFKITKLSNSVVERTISSVFSTSFSASQVGSAVGTMLSVDGHTFFCIATTSITWVYDTEEKIWYEWRTSGDVPFKPEAAWSKYDGGQYISLNGGTTIDFLSPLVYNDKNVNFTCSYTTEDNLFGSVNWKVCNRVSLVCDRYLSTGTSNVVLQWSDNDWTDNPTNSQDINVFSNMPIARRTGRFRNRSFRLLYTDNYPLRMKSLELEINIGAH